MSNSLSHRGGAETSGHDEARERHAGPETAPATVLPPQHHALPESRDALVHAATSLDRADLSLELSVRQARPFAVPHDPSLYNGEAFVLGADRLNVGGTTTDGLNGQAHLSRTEALVTVSNPNDSGSTLNTFGMTSHAAIAEFGENFSNGSILSGTGVISNNGLDAGMSYGRVTALGTAAGTLLLHAGASSDLKVVRVEKERAFLQYTRAIDMGVMLSLGLTTGALGGGLRIGANARQGVTVRRWLSRKHAQTAVKRHGRVQGYLEALRLSKASVPVPNLNAPVKSAGNATPSMSVADSVTVTTGGSLSGGLSLRAANVFFGVHVVADGEHEIHIEKTSEQAMRVVISPKNVALMVRGSIDAPLLAILQATGGKALALRSAYNFDLTKADAKQSYEHLLQGILPGPLVELSAASLSTGVQAIQAVNQARLPNGVTTAFVERGSVPMHLSLEASMTGLRMLLFGRFGGLGFAMRRIVEDHLIANSDVAVATSEMREVRHTDLLSVGAKILSVSLVSQETTYKELPLLPQTSLTLGTQIQYETGKPKQRRSLLRFLSQIGLLDQATLMQQKNIAKKLKPIENSVQMLTVEQDLNRDEMASLLQAGLLPNAQELGRRLSDSARGSDVESLLLKQVKSKLEAQVKEAPLQTFSKAMKLLGSEANPQVLTTSDAVAKFDSKVNVLQVKHHEPLTKLIQEPRQLKRRVSLVLDKVEEATEIADALKVDVVAQLDPKSWEKNLLTLEKKRHALLEMVGLNTLTPREADIIEQTLDPIDFVRLRQLLSAPPANPGVPR